METEKEKIDFMFRVIQYVERQVVLYDSVEEQDLISGEPNRSEVGRDMGRGCVLPRGNPPAMVLKVAVDTIKPNR